MARSFYADEEETYATPGLPTIPQPESLPLQNATTTSNTTLTVNNSGNLITTSPALQRFVSQLREKTVNYYTAASERLDRFTSTGHAHFFMTVDRVAEFKAEDEPLLPHACTVLTASLVGAIFARGRAFPLRFVTPLVFGGLALHWTMPHTFDNVAGSIKGISLAVEDSYFPSFRETRREASVKTHNAVVELQQLQNKAWEGLVQNVACVRKGIDSALTTVKKD